MAGSEWFRTRPGGLNRYFEDLYLALAATNGVQVSAHAFGDPAGDGSSWGVPRSLPKRVWASTRTKVEPGGIVDRHFALYGHGARSVERSGSTPVIHFQGPWSLESKTAGQAEMLVAAKRAFERGRYRGARLAVVLCKEFGEILVHEFGFDAARVVVIPPGVNLERFRVAPIREERDRGPKSVLCVRRLERRMGIDVLIRAWRMVVDSGSDTASVPHLDIVGVGTEGAALRELVETLDLDTHVTFHGRLDDAGLADRYEQSELTVIPTRSLEGFGLIALESLASGRAPIVSRVGGLPDAVEGLDGSLVVPPEDEDALAGRILSALGGVVPDPASCRRHAERFDWKLVAARHVREYETLLA